MTVSERTGLPLPPPNGPDRPSAALAGHGRVGDGHRPLLGVYLLIIGLIVFQRFVVPGTAVSAVLPLAYAALLLSAVRGQMETDRTRTLLYLAAVGTCTLAGLVASAWSGIDLSLGSIALLVVLYLPCCFRSTQKLRGQLPRVLEFFLRVMVCTAVACVLQWTSQLIGVPYQDPLSFVPPGLLVDPDAFNLSYPIFYGSDLYKSNGIVFLEPSFASQFLAVAIVVQVLLGGGRWRLVLFGAALLTTVSGTGLILLGVGLTALAVRRGGLWAVRALAALAVAWLLVSTTPVGEVLSDRAGETSEAGSSGNSRFVTPYTNVVAALADDQSALLVGRGPGSVDRDVDFFNPLGAIVAYTAPPKLVGEYGLPAALVFLAFVLVMFVRSVPSITLGLMSCVIFLLLSGALLHPPVVYLCWLLTGLFATEPRARTGR